MMTTKGPTNELKDIILRVIHLILIKNYVPMLSKVLTKELGLAKEGLDEHLTIIFFHE